MVQLSIPQHTEEPDKVGGSSTRRVLIALTQKGVPREDAYRLVQRNAMKVWSAEHEFLSLLKADPEVTKVLTPKEIEANFDLGFHLKHVDLIFKRCSAPHSRWRP